MVFAVVGLWDAYEDQEEMRWLLAAEKGEAHIGQARLDYVSSILFAGAASHVPHLELILVTSTVSPIIWVCVYTSCEVMGRTLVLQLVY